MISKRKIAANRANAKASTGPKTRLGKNRAAQNARRHGLSLSVLADPVCSVDAEIMAREIAGENATLEIVGLAHRIAEAQIDLVRVRQARRDLSSRDLCEPNYRPPDFFASVKRNVRLVARFARKYGPLTPLPPEMLYAVYNCKPEDPKKSALTISDLTRQLSAMDRYERRALSRRKFAIRDFDLARRGR